MSVMNTSHWFVCSTLEKCFMNYRASCFILKERDDYGVLVESLGGKMLDGQNFDPSCTHLVIGKAK